MRRTRSYSCWTWITPCSTTITSSPISATISSANSGPERRDRYWAAFEASRAGLGYVDDLGALQRYRLGNLNDPRLLFMECFLVDHPFAKRL
jgi:hypothetical protein